MCDEEEEELESFEPKSSITTVISKERFICVQNIITNNSPDVVVGYGLLFDPLLDYHLLTISSTSHSKFTELTLPTLPTSSPTLRSPSPIQTRRTTKAATYLAYPFPDDTPLTTPGKSALVGLRFPYSILREKDPLSMDAIKVLGDITVRIRNTVGSVLRVGEGLRRRYYSLSISKLMFYSLELQHKELSTQLSKLSSTYKTISSLQETAKSRNSRLESVKSTQIDFESRANLLLRKLLTISQPQTSEAEEKWFKELTRVKSRINGQRGLIAEVKSRLAEGRKFVELAGKKNENDEEGGKKKLDVRVMEAIEEA